MIMGRYPQGMAPQIVADKFTALLLDHWKTGNSKNNKDRERGPFAKGDNHWQLDGTNNFWIRVNPLENRYTLSCRYETTNQEQVLHKLKEQFDKLHPPPVTTSPKKN